MKALLACLSLLLTVSLIHADVPQLINYQGLLTDINGNVVAGNKSFSIAIFDAATDGTQLYSETIGSVAVQNGVYSFQFGNGPGFVDALGSGSQHWLQLTIDSIVQTPRERLVSVPFAIRAGTADSLSAKPATNHYFGTLSIGQLVDGVSGAMPLPVLLPVSTRGSIARSVFEPVPRSTKRITELSARATTTITTGSVTINLIRRDPATGIDSTLATIQKPSGTIGTATVSTPTDLTLDHSTYIYFLQVIFVAGDSSSLQTTLHWLKVVAEE